MAERIPLDKLEIMTPKELGKILVREVWWTPDHRRVLDIQYIKDIINAGASLNARDINGLTPLHTLAGYGNIELIKLLIEYGADIDDHTTHIGNTPLHIAAWEGQIKAIEVLVAAGADINIHNFNGYTPLHNAAGNTSVDIVMLLLRLGADLDALDNDGNTPLDMAHPTLQKMMCNI